MSGAAPDLPGRASSGEQVLDFAVLEKGRAGVNGGAGALWFGVLGPLEVRRDGPPLQLHGLQERAVLGVLLSQRNRAVSVPSLIEAMWGADPPSTAKKTLQSYVSRLRGLLEPDRGPAEWRS